MNRSRSAFALGVVATLLVAGGCSADDPQPKVAPSEPASASTSPSPTGPVEPTMPAAAKKHTAAGAEAFVEFYWEMVNYAQLTGDLSGLVRLSDPNCGACAGGLDFLRRIFNGGGEVRGGEVSVQTHDSIKVHAGRDVSFRVLADVTNTRQVVDMPGTRKDETYPAATSAIQFIVDPERIGWTVAYWDQAPS